MTLAEPVRKQITDLVQSNRVVLFMKGTRRFPQCGFSQAVVGILDEFLPSYETVNVLADPAIRDGIKAYSEWPTIPQLYVDGKFVGGCDIVKDLHASGELRTLLGAGPAEPVAPPKITISERAAKEISAASKEADGEPLRVAIDASYRNELFFDARADGDVEVVSSGVTVVLDRASASRADGLSIDFVEGPQGGGFKIENPKEPPRVKILTAPELKDRLARADGLVVFDVRGSAERAIASIAGSRALDEEGKAYLEGLDRATPVLFYCHHGMRSATAAEHYLRQGFKNVFNLKGGIDAWSASVDPSVRRY